MGRGGADVQSLTGITGKCIPPDAFAWEKTSLMNVLSKVITSPYRKMHPSCTVLYSLLDSFCILDPNTYKVGFLALKTVVGCLVSFTGSLSQLDAAFLSPQVWESP